MITATERSILVVLWANGAGVQDSAVSLRFIGFDFKLAFCHSNLLHPGFNCFPFFSVLGMSRRGLTFMLRNSSCLVFNDVL